MNQTAASARLVAAPAPAESAEPRYTAADGMRALASAERIVGDIHRRQEERIRARQR